MNKNKKIVPVLLIMCLTIGIALFSISASMEIKSADVTIQSQKSQLSSQEKLTKEASDSITSSAVRSTVSDTSSVQRTSSYEEHGIPDITAESRGMNRNTYDKADKKKKSSDSISILATSTSVHSSESEFPDSEEPRNSVAPSIKQSKETFSVQPQEVQAVQKVLEPQNVQNSPEKTSSQYEEDLDLLARLITAEAQGEPYEAQIAVGAVVINRVQSGLWANTIKGVIYQNINGYYQFTPVVNGWIDKPAEPECINAAKAAMNGSDPTNGAQFYYDDKSTNAWILSKPVSTQIGHLIYAY